MLAAIAQLRNLCPVFSPLGSRQLKPTGGQNLQRELLWLGGAPGSEEMHAFI